MYSAWKNNKVDLKGLSEIYPDKSAKSPFGRYPHDKSLSKALGLQQAERWYLYPKNGQLEYESMCDHLVAEWIEGSKRPTSILLKQVINKYMVVGGEIYNPNGYSIPAKAMESYSGVIAKMFDDTQNYLRKKNITSVKLFRGIKSEVSKAGVAESWTSNYKKAVEFGGYKVLEAEIPANKIFMYHEGPGWKNGKLGDQWEYIVLNEEPK